MLYEIRLASGILPCWCGCTVWMGRHLTSKLTVHRASIVVLPNCYLYRGYNMEALKDLAGRLSNLIGSNLQGFFAGIAVALYFMWSNQAAASRGEPKLHPSSSVGSPPATDANSAEPEGPDINEVRGLSNRAVQLFTCSSLTHSLTPCPLTHVPKAKHKEQIDRLISRAHHHRKTMNDDSVTVEHLVLALGENQR